MSSLGIIFEKKSDFIRNISILVQIFEKLDFGQNVWKILIEVKIFEISRFWLKSFKMSILVKIFEISRFWSQFSKI